MNPDFRAFDLNQGLDPTREMILVPSDLKGCIVPESELPERAGPCVVGLDIGESTSGTAATIIWPETGRTEFRFAFGAIPKLKDRQRRDGAPYVEMERRGELKLYPGRIVPVGPFLEDLIADLAGERVLMLAADYYKQSEAEDVLDRAKVRWPREFRRAGRGPQGGRDVRGFQRLVVGCRLKFLESLALASAIRGSRIHRDGNANPALDKSGSRDRIDVLSSAVIAGGAGRTPDRRTSTAAAADGILSEPSPYQAGPATVAIGASGRRCTIAGGARRFTPVRDVPQVFCTLRGRPQDAARPRRRTIRS